MNLATGVAYVDGWTDRRGSGSRHERRLRARTDDVRRPAAGAGEGREGQNGAWLTACGVACEFNFYKNSFSAINA